jgi:hypothetical protein
LNLKINKIILIFISVIILFQLFVMRLIILLLLFPLLIYSQQITLTGHITDKRGQSLQYVNVVSISKHNGTITNDSGYFVLCIDKNDSLKFSHIAFETKTIAVRDFTSGNIILIERSQSINEVVIKSFSSYPDRVKIGFFNKDRNGEFRLDPGSQIAVFIENPRKKAALIESIVFEVKKHGDCESRLRIRLLENYKNLKLPGRDILTDNYILNNRDLRQINSIDISKSKVILPQNGLFVLVEWLSPDLYCEEKSFPTLVANLGNKENNVWFNYRDKKWNNLSPPLTNGNYMTPNFSLIINY